MSMTCCFQKYIFVLNIDYKSTCGDVKLQRRNNFGYLVGSDFLLARNRDIKCGGVTFFLFRMKFNLRTIGMEMVFPCVNIETKATGHNV